MPGGWHALIMALQQLLFTWLMTKEYPFMSGSMKHGPEIREPG